MKHIKTWRIWEGTNTTPTPEQEEFLNKYTDGTWSVNPDGEVDVNGNFKCGIRGIDSLLGIRFGAVSGDFYCYENQLTSLEGAPREVGGSFLCYNNRLTTLEGAPQKVGGNFDCSYNLITSLEGAPREVGGDFWCYGNPIGENTPELIFEFMKGKPDLPYGAVLLVLQDKIPSEDWNKLDKSAIDRMSDKAQKGYKLLGGIGGL